MFTLGSRSLSCGNFAPTNRESSTPRCCSLAHMPTQGKPVGAAIQGRKHLSASRGFAAAATRAPGVARACGVNESEASAWAPPRSGRIATSKTTQISVPSCSRRRISTAPPSRLRRWRSLRGGARRRAAHRGAGPRSATDGPARRRPPFHRGPSAPPAVASRRFRLPAFPLPVVNDSSRREPVRPTLGASTNSGV